jgi:uncharacterized protein YbjT (DUF2867 family)
MGVTVLVTGATGKTGRRLVPLLRDRGVTVRAAGRNPAPVGTHVEPVRFDWADERTYRAALDGVDAVYAVGVTFTAGVGDPTAQVETFLGRAVESGVRRIVLLSSFGVDRADAGEPLRRLELFVERAGVASTILRPGAFMQNFSEQHWLRLATGIRERGEIALPGGEHPVSYISASDIAAVAALALTEPGHEGKGYPLTGPESLTLAEVAEHISTAAGRPVRYVESGPETLRDALLAAGASAQFAEYAAGLYLATAASGALATVTGDVATLLGRPATTFARFAEGAADAWR